ncbi:MAG TPA: DUF1684 domain-containing protein [Terriglobales bacterium]|nr:DUF1684 domain-containing protein [Terriglobales bacterium]
MQRTRITILVLLAVLSVPIVARSQSHVDAVYQREVEKFRAEEIKDLKSNWLVLAGLFWLKPGANAFGTASSNPIVLPAGTAPAKAGVFELTGDEVTLKMEPGAAAIIDNQPVMTAKLQPDVSGKPTVIALGRLRMHVIKRGERIGIRLKDLQNPALRNFTSLHFYPIDTAYRITATWVPSDGKQTVEVPNVLGDVTAETVPGEVRFTINGQKLTLTALGGDAAKGLFFVFSDTTSKTDTYPAGRFLEADAVQDGKVVLDFNKAYNPPCAVTPYATCPIAPKENRLAVAIPAGEKFDHSKPH